MAKDARAEKFHPPMTTPPPCPYLVFAADPKFQSSPIYKAQAR